MRGIPEERLKVIAAMPASVFEAPASEIINYLIAKECHELQEPWIPVDENAPRDRQIKIYDAGYGQVVVQWNAYFRCFTDPHGHKYLNPTHYQELPAGPVMPIHKPEPPK